MDRRIQGLIDSSPENLDNKYHHNTNKTRNLQKFGHRSHFQDERNNFRRSNQNPEQYSRKKRNQRLGRPGNPDFRNAQYERNQMRSSNSKFYLIFKYFKDLFFFNTLGNQSKRQNRNFRKNTNNEEENFDLIPLDEQNLRERYQHSRGKQIDSQDYNPNRENMGKRSRPRNREDTHQSFGQDVRKMILKRRKVSLIRESLSPVQKDLTLGLIIHL